MKADRNGNPVPGAGRIWLRRDGLPRAWLFAVMAAVGLLAGLGLRDPWPPDEPRFAIIGLEFLRNGDWLFPRIGGILYPDKPPVFLWLEAGFESLTGSMRWGFLLPSLFAALATLLMTWDLGRRLWGRRAGMATAVALLITLQFVLQARQAQIDMTLTAFTTLGLYGLARDLLAGPACGWYLAGFAGMALGVLTKGVGFLPLLALLPWALAHRFANPSTLTRFRGFQWCWMAGPPLFVAIILVWLAPMLAQAAHAPPLAEYRDAILFHHTVDRYAHGWDHLKPWWYYLVQVIPVYWLPLSALTPWLLPAFWRRIRRGDARYWFLLGWILLVLGFFSAADGKRAVYLLPAVPALALASGPLLPALLRRQGVQRAGLTLIVGVALLAGLGLAWGYLLHPETAARIAERYDQVLWPYLAVPLGLALAWLTFALRCSQSGFYAFIGLTFSLWGVLGLVAYPAADPVMSGRAFVERVDESLPPGTSLGLANWSERYLLYFDRPVTHFGHRRPDERQEALEAMEWVIAGTGRRLLAPMRHTGDCVDPEGARPMGYHSGNRWWVISADSMKQDCIARLLELPEPQHVVTVPPLRDGAAHTGS